MAKGRGIFEWCGGGNEYGQDGINEDGGSE